MKSGRKIIQFMHFVLNFKELDKPRIERANIQINIHDKFKFIYL